MVAVLAAALVAFAVPLAVAVGDLLESRALDDLEAQAQLASQFIDTGAASCSAVEAVVRQVASREGTAALSLFSGTTGRLVLRPVAHRPTAREELVRAIEGGVVGRRHGGGSLAVAIPLSTRVCGDALVLHAERPDAALSSSVRRAWLGLAVVGAAVLGLAAGMGRLVSGRLARPLHDLAGSAAALGEGDFSVRIPRSGVEEVDAIAVTLDRTAERLGRAVDRGRAFAADASHQLRTPLTALRLQLEGLQGQGVAPESVAAALAEADRLEATVEELVALTSLDTVEEVVAPEDLVSSPVAAARAGARTAGRDLELAVVPAPHVRTRPAAIRQALQVLLDNALEHGRGTITVRISPTLPDEPVPGRDARQGLRVCVSDEGPGPDPGALRALRARDRGTTVPLAGGRGLALARALVEGEGGRLTTDEDAFGRVRTCLVLPVRGGPPGPLVDGPLDPGGI